MRVTMMVMHCVSVCHGPLLLLFVLCDWRRKLAYLLIVRFLLSLGLMFTTVSLVRLLCTLGAFPLHLSSFAVATGRWGWCVRAVLWVANVEQERT